MRETLLKSLTLIAMFFVLFLGSPAGAQDRLSISEIEALLVGNTETGSYVYEGETSAYSEFIDPNGEIRGKDRWAEYKGSWEIKGDCYYADYEGNEFDGCYIYAKDQEGKYYGKKEDATDWNEIKILEGNPSGL